MKNQFLFYWTKQNNFKIRFLIYFIEENNFVYIKNFKKGIDNINGRYK